MSDEVEEIPEITEDQMQKLMVFIERFPIISFWIMRELMNRLEKKGVLNLGEGNEIIRVGLNNWRTSGATTT